MHRQCICVCFCVCRVCVCARARARARVWCVLCVCVYVYVCERALLSLPITLLVGVTELHPNLKQSIIIGCNPPVSIIIEAVNNWY